ncbi:MAG: hypothetical protein Q3972_06335 [Corynebacterium sp.]|nr:hypothetical protein [Corynebacterium sp.]
MVAATPQAGAVTVATTDAADRCVLTFSQQEMRNYETTLNALVEKFDGVVTKINPDADFSQKPAAIQALKAQHKVDMASGQHTFFNDSLKEWEMPNIFRMQYVMYGEGSGDSTVHLDDLTEIPRDLAIYAHALGVIDEVNDQSIEDMVQYFDKDSALAWLEFFEAADGLAMIQGADGCAGLTALAPAAEEYTRVHAQAYAWAQEAHHTIEEGPNYPPIDASEKGNEREENTSKDEAAKPRGLMDPIVIGSSKVSLFILNILGGILNVVGFIGGVLLLPIMWLSLWVAEKLGLA